MQKKLIALAVAAALTTPALAMADVTFYGKAFLNVESVSNDQIVPAANANAAAIAAFPKNSAMRINSNASRLGVKGGEDLGDGLKGIFQFEVQMDANGNAGNGLGNGTRNSGVGLEGDFGKVIIGIWDTPYKVAHNKVELFDNTTSFSSLNIIGRSNAGVNNTNVNNTVNFNTRQKNVVQYWTPNVAGFVGALSYSPDPAPTNSANKSLVSLSGTYDVDAIYAALGYETRADATIAGQSDTALRLVGRYSLGDVLGNSSNISVGGAFESIKVNTTATTNITQKNAELVGQYAIGKESFGLSYARAGGSQANQVSLRAGHSFSKKVEGFLAYTTLDNKTTGAYGFNSSAIFGTAAQQVKSKQTAFGTGLIVSF